MIAIKTSIPGPESRKLMAELAEYESPAITARQLSRTQAGGMDCPIVWKKTADIFVEDVDGNCFMDLTAGFGVASVGHAHPELVHVAQQQMAEMPHAMGDAFPAYNKVALVKKLAQITPGHLKRTLLANSGFEAVEVALKTAMIKTGKPGVIAFDKAYHGLGYGALAVTSYRERFREPFLSQLNPHIHRLPYPAEDAIFSAQLEKTIQEAEKTASPIGALIIEPILGRGGIIEAPIECLQHIREITKRYNVAMIVDEICTGFGRTGDWFAIENATVIPDLLCMGKGMNGGFPISGTIGTDEVMSGWGDAQGEAIHTSTFLGNPVGCAMALKCIDLLEKSILGRVKPLGEYFKEQLLVLHDQFSSISEIRGRGLMLGIEFKNSPKNLVLILSKRLLQKGFIVLPCGLDGDTLSLTPPLTIQKEHIDLFIHTLKTLLSV
jgi:4-aminobutyrate aminotransferase / (S)-3-amino-2-methylpropionate transaminase / 5-aminovalerate transaminase